MNKIWYLESETNHIKYLGEFSDFDTARAYCEVENITCQWLYSETKGFAMQDSRLLAWPIEVEGVRLRLESDVDGVFKQELLNLLEELDDT